MSRCVHVGYGLLIPHGGPMVVNITTRMGDNCNLCHIVNIGSAYNKAAELGNEVLLIVSFLSHCPCKGRII